MLDLIILAEGQFAFCSSLYRVNLTAHFEGDSIEALPSLLLALIAYLVSIDSKEFSMLLHLQLKLLRKLLYVDQFDR
ncbi:hypothetical protein D3C85_1320990 [compost metagenome]